MRIATFNILHGRSLSDDVVDVERFADAVRTLDADVLALQEVDRAQPRSHHADLTAVAAEAMGARSHRFVATLHGKPGLWRAATGRNQPASAAYGISLLSRHPVSHWRAVRLPALPGLIPVIFPGGSRPALVRDEPRCAVAAVVHTPGGRMTVVGTHLTVVPRWNGSQLRRLVRRVDDLPRPLLVMGDLNIDAPEPERITGLHPLASLPTFPVHRPRRQIDHILAAGPLRVLAPPRAIDLGVSDHRALVVDVEPAHAARD